MATQSRTKKKPKDPFASLRPKSAEVPVGHSILVIRTATLEQESQLMSLLTDLDLGALLGPLADVLSTEIDDDGAPTGGLAVLPKLGAIGPQLWAAAQKLLGHQFVPAMRGCATVLLDTKQNKKLLIGADVVDLESDDDTSDDGLFAGCPSVRRWLCLVLLMPRYP